MSDLPTPTERIVDEAAAAAEASQDLRTAVRELTLRALEHRALDLGQLRQVFSAVTEGVSLGLARRGGEIKDAASDALAGLTDAAQKAAEATRLAAEQLLAEGKALTDEDLKPVVDDLRRLEQEKNHETAVFSAHGPALCTVGQGRGGGARGGHFPWLS
jgi:hypothetical protein